MFEIGGSISPRASRQISPVQLVRQVDRGTWALSSIQARHRAPCPHLRRVFESPVNRSTRRGTVLGPFPAAARTTDRVAAASTPRRCPSVRLNPSAHLHTTK